ncbi:hypothetical protein LCGC14_3053400, partial [marine sediment metagenome]
MCPTLISLDHANKGMGDSVFSPKSTVCLGAAPDLTHLISGKFSVAIGRASWGRNQTVAPGMLDILRAGQIFQIRHMIIRYITVLI